MWFDPAVVMAFVGPGACAPCCLGGAPHGIADGSLSPWGSVRIRVECFSRVEKESRVADDDRGQSEGAIVDQHPEPMDEHPEAMPAGQPAPVEPEIPGRHWYAIHTYSGYENKV